MKHILERMFDDEDQKHDVRIRLALLLIVGELSKPEPEITNTNHIIAILLDPIFKERGLPSLPFPEASND